MDWGRGSRKSKGKRILQRPVFLYCWWEHVMHSCSRRWTKATGFDFPAIVRVRLEVRWIPGMSIHYRGRDRDRIPSLRRFCFFWRCCHQALYWWTLTLACPFSISISFFTPVHIPLPIHRSQKLILSSFALFIRVCWRCDRYDISSSPCWSTEA